MTTRDRELLDVGKHAKRKIEQAIQDAAQLCDNDYERMQMIMALQIHLLQRLSHEYGELSPIVKALPPDVRLFTTATFAARSVASVTKDEMPSFKLTESVIERAWRAMVLNIGKLEGAPKRADG